MPASRKRTRTKSRSRKMVVRRRARSVSRRRPVIRRVGGQGRYDDEGNSVARLGAFLGGALGMSVGGPFGSVAGSLAGAAVGKGFSKITGLGKYNVNRNTVLHPKQGDQIPSFGNLGDAVRIRKREYIGDIYSSQTFVNNSFPLDISNTKTFPWLSQLSPLFQQYKWHGIMFEFRSMSSNALNSTDTALGSVIGTCNYNVNELPYASKVQMENTIFAMSVKPSTSCMFPIECEPTQTPSLPLYTKVSPAYQIPGAVNDNRLNSMGTFQIATTGMQQADVNIGELWVTYDVCLYKEQLDDGYGYNVASSHANQALGLGDCVVANPLGVNPALYVNYTNNLLNLGTDKVTNYVYFGSAAEGNNVNGEILTNFYWYLDSAQIADSSPPKVVSYTNCTPVNVFFQTNSVIGTGSSTSMSLSVIISPIDPALQYGFTLDTATSSYTGTATIDILATQLNGGIH